MGLVLWIDQNEVATGLFERVFKAQDKGFYSLTGASDFGYLIADLGPHVIVLDVETVIKDMEVLRRQYESSGEFGGRPVVLIGIGMGPELSFIKNIVGTLKRPLNPFCLPEQIEGILNKTAI